MNTRWTPNIIVCPLCSYEHREPMITKRRMLEQLQSENKALTRCHNCGERFEVFWRVVTEYRTQEW